MNKSQNRMGEGIFGNHLKAFTLAEVLITLVIIGVIAAITVPTMMTNYKKQETISRLKKVYSALSQTTNRAILDNGSIVGWDISLGSEEFLKTYVFPYLDVDKNCGEGTSDDCTFIYKTIAGEVKDISSRAKFYLRDGSKLAVFTQNSSPDEKFVYFHVDINGDAKPNRMGRDVFVFIYYIENYSAPKFNSKFMQVYPFWDREQLKTHNQTGCNKTNTHALANYSCAALIMNDGWEIKDDYPW